jgi:short subunit dehydrogenase-like uncharacterized protein
MRPARPYDVVLFGATGFTGKLVAEYLAKQARAGRVKWAIAGRSRDKLEAVKRELALDVPVLVADADDAHSLDALVPEGRVVCTTVGPYDRYGKKLVEACTRHGTHYCDITGEVPFVRWSIDTCHARAAGGRTRIVHCCGFDSIPFDLGVHMLFAHAKKKLAWAKGFVGELKGGSFSGGTLASMMNLAEEMTRDRAVRRLVANPHALDPDPSGQKDGDRDRDQTGVRFDRDLGRWTAPFLMAQVNTRIVRRSNALLHYGDTFRYAEAMSTPPGPRGMVMAAGVTVAMGAFVAVATVPRARRLLARRLPKPGEGPSREAREKGSFKVRVLAETESGERLAGRVEGHADPGYGETAKMLGESALCLARGEDDASLPDRFGVLTPASAMGMRLVERLRAAGITFAVDAP